MVTLKDIIKAATEEIRKATGSSDGQATLDVIEAYLDEHGPSVGGASGVPGKDGGGDDGDGKATVLDKFSSELFYLYSTTVLTSPIAVTVVSCTPEAQALHTKQRLLLTFYRALVPLLGPHRLFNTSWWQKAIHPILTTATYTDAIKNEARGIVIDSLILELNTTTTTTASRIVDDYLASAKKYQDREQQHIEAVLDASAQGQDDIRLQHQALLAMDQDEWSKNLLSILMAIGAAKTKPFFCLLDKYFQNSHDRLQIVYLLSEFMLRKRTHAHEILETPLFDSMLKSLMYDNSTTLIAISVTNMIMLLPRICAMLPPFLPRLFYIFARAISWDQLRDMRKRQSIVASPRPKMDLTWDCADYTFSKLAAPPSNPQTGPFFTALYGLYPCNFLKFLRKPYAYFESVGFVVPEEFDEETFRTRTVGQVTRHMLHPTLVTMTAATELTDQSRWMKMEPPDVIALVMSLDLTNAASRSAFSSTINPTNAPNSMDLLDTSIWSATKDQTPTASSIATEETQEQREQQQEQQQQQRGSLPQKLPQHPLAPPLHHPQPVAAIDTTANNQNKHLQPQHAPSPSTSATFKQPMMETIVNMHKALKSGSEILAGDDIWDATILQQHVTSPSVSTCTSPHVKMPSAASQPFAPVPDVNHMVEGASAAGDASTTSAAQQAAILQQAAANMSSETKLLIAGLKREVLLLRNELTFELFLKQQHLQHIGRLHREHVMDSTVEAERQQLYNANRMLRAQLTQTTAALEKLRTETAMAKQKHIKWEDDQSGKLRGYRDARKEWQAHMEVVKKDLDDLRLVVDDRTMELEQARKVIFDLQNEVTTLQPMVEKASNYEQRIRQLTQQMLLWEEDTAHLKEQKKYIKGLLSQWWSMEELVASLQAENRAHEEELSQRAQVPRAAPVASAPPTNPAAVFEPSAARQKELDELKQAMRALKDELTSVQMDKIRLQADLERYQHDNAQANDEQASASMHEEDEDGTQEQETSEAKS